jgi:hypothetical protein
MHRNAAHDAPESCSRWRRNHCSQSPEYAVRTARQKPAHAIDENVFDQKYIKDQRDLIIRVYSAIRTVRLILANHPKVQAAEIEIPEWVRNGEIWGY